MKGVFGLVGYGFCIEFIFKAIFKFKTMKELKDICCSLKLAKRLEELGVKQESAFYWFEHKVNKRKLLAFKTEIGYYSITGAGFSSEYLKTCNVFSAFTTGEIGNILIAHRKEWEENEKMKFPLPDDPLKDVFDVNFWAKMLIYLLENKLIKI